MQQMVEDPNQQPYRVAEVVSTADNETHESSPNDDSRVAYTVTTTARQRPFLVVFLLVAIAVMIAIPFNLEHLIVQKYSVVDISVLLMTALPTLAAAAYYWFKIRPRFDVYNEKAQHNSVDENTSPDDNGGKNEADGSSVLSTPQSTPRVGASAFPSPSRDMPYRSASAPHILQFPEVFIRYGMGWLCLPLAGGGGLFLTILLSIPLHRVMDVFSPDRKTSRELLFFLFYPCFILCEELVKFAFMNGMNKHQSLPHYRLYPLYGTAVALGCATAEVYYDVAMVRFMLDFYHRMSRQNMVNPDTGNPINMTLPPGIGDHESNVGDIFAWSVMGILVFIPAHILCSYHVGLALSRFQVLKHRIYPITTVLIAAVARC